MDFHEKIRSSQTHSLTSREIRILQVNLGYKCNMSCKHCHIDAGPHRNEEMSRQTVDMVLKVLRENNIRTLDITGGAPELNANFNYLVRNAEQTGCHIIVRTNLTVFFEDGMLYLSEFYADHSVEVVASLPYYRENDVDRVRGPQTFEKSIRAIETLNKLGYATGSSDMKLNLVYNPAGAFLPPPQATLEEYYKNMLSTLGISFDKLYTFANMPIGRFRDFLLRSKNLDNYMGTLMSAFNPAALDSLMCRYLVSVGWDGMLYDCDFNQILGLRVNNDCPQHIKNFDYHRLAEREIIVGEHCYGCTAGQGST